MIDIFAAASAASERAGRGEVIAKQDASRPDSPNRLDDESRKTGSGPNWTPTVAS
jgi:hypothetical protein